MSTKTLLMSKWKDGFGGGIKGMELVIPIRKVAACSLGDWGAKEKTDKVVIPENQQHLGASNAQC